MPSSDFLKMASTKDVPVPKLLVDQIVGQEKAVELIRKAAIQRRNVLLVGLPGTGKSMLAKAMSEIMPLQKLSDILVYQNDEDPNTPMVRTVKAGEGQKILEQARLEGKAQEDNMRLIGILLPLGWFILSYVLWTLKYLPDVVYAATLIMGAFLMVGFVLGSQVRVRTGIVAPKLLINNSGKKIAPYLDGTGARAGALLGDVRHDPLQSFEGFNGFLVQKKDLKGLKLEKKTFNWLWSEVVEKYPQQIILAENGYEAIMLPPEEKIYTLGYKDGKPVLSRILSLNRRPYEGELIDIETAGSRISLTPEHKVDIMTNEAEARKLTTKDKLIKLFRAAVLTAVQK